MFDAFLTSQMLPFTGAIGLLIGLVVLEGIALLFGGSLFGGDVNADVDLDTDFDFDADFDSDAMVDVASTEGILSWLGLGRIPIIMWFAAVLAGFGGAGYLIQVITLNVFGGMIPGALASILALPLALLFGREVGTVIARYMPKSETSSVSLKRLGGRTGVITQGTARASSAAEARVHDVHGNPHYIRVIPAEGTPEIPQGTEVLVLRDREGVFRAQALNT